MKVKEVLHILEELAPLHYTEGFDNTGLLVGDNNATVTGILVTLDTLESIVDEAIATNCNLIVSFHPIVFSGLKKITGKTYVERVVQKAIKHDIQFIYDKIREKVKERYIILYGRSLGSGFATKLASMNKPKMLILDAPYYSLKNVTGRYMPFMPLSIILRYPLPTYKWLKYVNCPIRIIHGTQDKLIPFKSSVKLSQIKPNQTRLYPVIAGGHKNLNTFEEYHKILNEIITSEEKDIDLTTTSIGVKHSYKK